MVGFYHNATQTRLATLCCQYIKIKSNWYANRACAVSIECLLFENQIAIHIQKVIFRKHATTVSHRSASEKLLDVIVRALMDCPPKKSCLLLERWPLWRGGR